MSFQKPNVATGVVLDKPGASRRSLICDRRCIGYMTQGEQGLGSGAGGVSGRRPSVVRQRIAACGIRNRAAMNGHVADVALASFAVLLFYLA